MASLARRLGLGLRVFIVCDFLGGKTCYFWFFFDLQHGRSGRCASLGELKTENSSRCLIFSYGLGSIAWDVFWFLGVF